MCTHSFILYLYDQSEHTVSLRFRDFYKIHIKCLSLDIRECNVIAITAAGISREGVDIHEI